MSKGVLDQALNQTRQKYVTRCRTIVEVREGKEIIAKKNDVGKSYGRRRVFIHKEKSSY